MTKPITPREALRAAPTRIPEVVFEVFNEFLSERARPRRSIRIGQDEVLAALIVKGWTAAEVTEALEKGELDVEPHFEKAGWTVKYDKPGYNETYEAHWIFEPGRR